VDSGGTGEGMMPELGYGSIRHTFDTHSIAQLIQSTCTSLLYEICLSVRASICHTLVLCGNGLMCRKKLFHYLVAP